jgi:hypothetical protein
LLGSLSLSLSPKRGKEHHHQAYDLADALPTIHTIAFFNSSLVAGKLILGSFTWIFFPRNHGKEAAESRELLYLRVWRHESIYRAMSRHDPRLVTMRKEWS